MTKWIQKTILTILLIGILIVGCVSFYSGYKDLTKDTETKDDNQYVQVTYNNDKETTKNTCPILSEIDDLEMNAGSTITIEIAAADAEDDNLEFEFSGLPADAELEDNVLTWDSEKDDDGEYEVIIYAYDGDCLAETSFILTVNEVEDDEDDEENVCPVIESSTITATEGDLIDLTSEFTDKNDDELTITYSGLFDENNQWQTEVGDAGSYSITVTVDDGNCEVTQSLTIIINEESSEDDGDEDDDDEDDDDEDDETENTCPVITVGSGMTITEGETARIISITSDVDGDALTLSYSEPFNADGTWQTEVGDAGEYDIIISANDGECTTSTTWHLIVLETEPETESTKTLNDIEVADVNIVDSDLNAGYVVYEITVKNTGILPVRESFFVSSKFETETSTTYKLNSVTLGLFDQEATFEVKFTFNPKYATATNMELTVNADSSNRILEDDEDNNIFTLGSIAHMFA